MRAYPELTAALGGLLDKIDASLAGYQGSPILMFLAGGLAVNYYCGTRYTADVDASFSVRPLLDFKKLTVDYTQGDGTKAFLYLDPNYNTSFAILHEDFENDSITWEGIGNERRKVKLNVLSPLDLAVSKISRFSDQDREDILALASMGFFSPDDLRKRTIEALSNYIGDRKPVLTTLDIITRQIAGL